MSGAHMIRSGVTAAVRAAARCWPRRRADRAAWEEGASSACRTCAFGDTAGACYWSSIRTLIHGKSGCCAK